MTVLCDVCALVRLRRVAQEYFLDVQLPNFVEKCLVSKFKDRDMVPAVHTFLQSVVKVSPAVPSLTTGPAHGC